MLSGLVPSNADAYLDSMTNFRVLLPSFVDLYLVSHTFTEFRGLVPVGVCAALPHHGPVPAGRRHGPARRPRPGPPDGRHARRRPGITQETLAPHR